MKNPSIKQVAMDYYRKHLKLLKLADTVGSIPPDKLATKLYDMAEELYSMYSENYKDFEDNK